ncbi:MAG: hypothetical protein IKP66_07430 [Lachnospiraceae bacterium]|nr:hypothetical protein [Lachnospiraceae bacterium]
MQIDIANEEIEKMLQKEVSARVKTWFGDPEHKDSIRKMVISAVDDAVREQVRNSMIDIPKLVAKLETKHLASDIVNCVADDIAEMFKEKYID